MNISYKDKIGDGKFPNQYWVSVSNDYLYLHDGNRCDWIGDIIPTFKSKGKTIVKAFKTYMAAKRYCDYEFTLGHSCKFGFVVNRINIEDRLSGELYESTRVFNPDTATVKDLECESVNFTMSTMGDNGFKFE
jgi:hypothetical protein